MITCPCQVYNEDVRDLLSESLGGVCIDYDQSGHPRLAGLNMVSTWTLVGIST